MILLYTAIIALITASVQTYHDAGNVRYHCWPNGAIAGDQTVDCSGLALAWPEEPPDEVEIGKKFNVTYQLLVLDPDEFYSSEMIFGNKSEKMVRNLCGNTTCPEPRIATADNCCVWHANIHTCHPTVTSAGLVCGPWVANNGKLSTHTDALVGLIGTLFFAKDVKIDFEGPNIVIAHLKVGNIQIALGKTVTVTPRKFCGDDVCDNGESCSTCATDCCGASFPLGATVGIVVFCVVLATTIAVAILGWYYFQRRKLFFDEGWIVNYDDIKQTTLGPMGSLSSLKNMQNAATFSQIRNRQLFTKTGLYEGRTVAIKQCIKKDLVVSDSVRREVMQIRTLDHPNLCKFIGATVKNLHKLCIINEYCPKGSLNDVLQNDDIPLNWGFRFSFASDITRGMAYLHSKRITHGRLTSSNVTIDDRWVVKISDYGLPSFREQDKDAICGLDEMLSNRALVKVYQPPEHRGAAKIIAAPASDVYSYAIILVEIATRMDPFSEEVFLDSNWKPAITKEHLTNSDNPCPCPDAYLELIDRCWSFLPTNRPGFDQIKKMLDRINPSRGSPVDMMMIMMEKYSKHLETLVAERTQELILEQKKTATLLYSMLPRAVADDLKHDKPAPAKMFQSSTIYFSDIVGFTTLAGSSTPFEVVTLLNELYSTFDDILDHFDVYKVETIGDAYMVVSGVPHENGDSHASEIAKMSLSLLAACKTFSIPHRPNTKLEIRIGIHSGPVCAGVVGLKMPRYCLFGDTVNTASRMESNSEAMKIQCSDTTYQLLRKQGGFRLDCRGSIEIKGKGSMVTWWLMGQEEQPRRDSLTGINMLRTDSRNNNLPKNSTTGISKVRSEGSQPRKNSLPLNSLSGRSEGNLPSQRNTLPRNDNVPLAISEGNLQFRRGSLTLQNEAVAPKISDGQPCSRGQSYSSKIVSFSSHHQSSSSSSQEQLDHNLSLPGTVVTDNEPLLL